MAVSYQEGARNKTSRAVSLQVLFSYVLTGPYLVFFLPKIYFYFLCVSFCLHGICEPLISPNSLLGLSQYGLLRWWPPPFHCIAWPKLVEIVLMSVNV